MHFTIPYARERIGFDVRDRNLAFFVHRSQLPAAENVDQLIVDAMRQPYGLPPIGKLTSGKDRIIILVDDVTQAHAVKEDSTAYSPTNMRGRN